jgi:HEAT repeat protein
LGEGVKQKQKMTSGHFRSQGLRGPEEESDALAAIKEALDDENVSKRVLAVLKLREVAPREAIKLLVQFLKDNEDAVVSEAIDTLGYIAQNSQYTHRVFRLLEEKARDKEFRARGKALIMASRLGKNDEILPIIDEFIADEDDETCKIFASRALTFVAGPECIPQVSRLLEICEDPEVQRNSLITLARMDSEEALEILQTHIIASDSGTQTYSAWALSAINNPEHNDILTDALLSGELGYEAVSTIARSNSAAEVFSEVLDRGAIDMETRNSILDVIAENTRMAPGPVRVSVNEMLEGYLNTEDPDELVPVLNAMAETGGGDEDTAQKLAEKFDSESPFVQGAALQAFTQYLTPKNYTHLVDLWWDNDQKIRRTAFFLSEHFLTGEDRSALEKAAAEHSDEFIKKHADLMLKQVLKVQ